MKNRAERQINLEKKKNDFLLLFPGRAAAAAYAVRLWFAFSEKKTFLTLFQLAPDETEKKNT